MKKIVFMLAFATTFTAQANTTQLENNQIEQSYQLKKKGKYAIMVQNKMMLMSSIMTGQEMLKNNPKSTFEIVMIAAAVKDIAEDNELKEMMKKANAAGIKFTSCEFAMNKLGVNKSQYLEFVQTTPNAFIYLFELQEKGFKQIIL
ncbi:DsrE family protein [Empedobacter stercoris]|uniref:DsrE family protein n=1 Tax=Empedobacter stercoris TaxID=1628248 RepID=A0ABX1WPC2_9FLAO|nr:MULTISPECIES: DsrE family protein [Empedobacter]HJD87678.1 DsrE family protein [Empedobacter falsenii]MCA4777958.1 DsrE family protein [Empedobacter stercoris]MCA4783017.1 DsrE family protein [Empedobacter stercoris]MCA4809845.1 DsrE family protein [Empedobacter stercoris]MDM1522620.1 DsrE family protein [Empedobacter sp. 225-1]